MSTSSRAEPRRVFAVTLIATLLVQLAWALALPAFRGIDEFDHVYKAEAVAHGMFRHAGSTPNGRGPLVAVPADIVEAAAARCSDYEYTKPDNCRPVAQTSDGLVLVSSAAATYNPTYYLVVGTLAMPFSGASAVFAMRAVTAVLTALLLAAAASVTSGWSRTGWPLMALFVAVTPMLAYSGAVVSPNGLGYAAGCLLWASVLGLCRAPSRLHLLSATVSACTVLVTHSTGVVWLALVLGLALLLAPSSHWLQIVRSMPRAATAATSVTALTLAFTVGWIVTNATNAPGSEPATAGDMPWGQVPTYLLLWMAQTIGAFPIRNDPAPLPVYGLWAIPFFALLILGLRRSTPRVRMVFGLTLAAWVIIPVVATAWTYAVLELAWQGRYALVLAVGFPAIAGLALEQSGERLSRSMLVGPTILCAVSMGWSVAAVTARESVRPLAPAFADLLPGSPGLLGAVVGIAMLWPLWLLRGQPRAFTSQQSPEPLNVARA